MFFPYFPELFRRPLPDHYFPDQYARPQSNHYFPGSAPPSQQFALHKQYQRAVQVIGCDSSLSYGRPATCYGPQCRAYVTARLRVRSGEHNAVVSAVWKPIREVTGWTAVCVIGLGIP